MNPKEVAGYGKGVNADYLCLFPILTSSKHNCNLIPPALPFPLPPTQASVLR